MRTRALLAATTAAVALLAGCSHAHEEPLLTGGPLWGMGRDRNISAESITIHEDTVLIARYDGGSWALDALSAATGRRRWTHRIWSFRATGFDRGRAATGPVVVGSGAQSLALIRDFSRCDDLGNCAEDWMRYGITALSVADGTVAWTTMAGDEPATRPADAQRYTDARLTGSTDTVAVMSVASGSSARDPNAPSTPAVVGVDLADGHRLWEKPDLRGVYVAGDTVIANGAGRPDRRGEPEPTGEIVALDARTGTERWRASGKNIVAAAGSRDLVLAKSRDSTDNPNLRWSLVAVADGTLQRTDEELGECSAARLLIACVDGTELRVVTGERAATATRTFTSIGPAAGEPVGEFVSLVEDYERGPMSGSYAVDAEATIWQGDLPGRIIALSDRYAVLDVSYRHTWSDRIAVYEVRR